MATQRIFLGSAVSLGCTHLDGHVVIDNKPGVKQELIDELESAANCQLLEAAQAGKLRGKLSWSGSNSYGKCGRLGMYQLKRRQYALGGDQGPHMDVSMVDGVRFLAHMVRIIAPRRIQVMGLVRPQAIVYSDASFQQDFDELPKEMQEPPRIGWVIMRHNLGDVPLGRSMILPPEALQLFTPRKTQIFACEAIAVPEALRFDGKAVAGRDVTWFIDNEAACSSFIRGASRSEDVSEVVAIALLMCQMLNTRIWFEWIDSDSNPSDGLSRAGIADAWTMSQGWSLQELSWEDQKVRRCTSLREWRWQVA